MNSYSIDDIAQPQLTQEQQQIHDMFATISIDLDMNAILQEAQDATQLSDFGDDSFKERLSVLTHEWDNDALISNIGRFSLRNKLLQDARNRLLILDQWKQYPEILDIELESPLIIAGLPRSGTTHLLNLLAADPRLRSMPYWLSCEPVPLPSERDLVIDSAQQDPRYQRCAMGWDNMQRMVPALAIMHPMSPDHIHEEIEIMNPNFSASNYEWMTPPPQWRDYYLSHDQSEHYAFMKNVLKLLVWQQRQTGQSAPERWVLKCIQHLEQLPALHSVFPDATIIYTHRDPVAVVQSIITMLGYSQRINRHKVELEYLLEYWTTRIADLLRTSLRDRHYFNQQQSVDVLFHQFMDNNMAVLHRIYQQANLPITAKENTIFNDYIENHQRGKDGQIIYKLERDFGISPSELRQSFDFYFDAFDVKPEV